MWCMFTLMLVTCVNSSRPHLGRKEANRLQRKNLIALINSWVFVVFARRGALILTRQHNGLNNALTNTISSIDFQDFLHTGKQRELCQLKYVMFICSWVMPLHGLRNMDWPCARKWRKNKEAAQCIENMYKKLHTCQTRLNSFTEETGFLMSGCQVTAKLFRF